MSETTAELVLLTQLTRIDLVGRSILTLNRDREYAMRYAAVRIADLMFDDMHGQIIVVMGTR